MTTPHPTDGRGSDDLARLQVVLDYYLHQNQLMWDRVTHFVAVQAAVIAGAFALRDIPVLAACVPLLGVVLSLILLWVFNRDEQIRDANKALLAELTAAVDWSASGLRFSLGPRPRGAAPFKASSLLRCTFALFILVDIGLGAWLLIHPWPAA